MRALRFLHTAYGMLIFSLLFIIVFFPLLIPIIFPRQFRLTGIVNRAWAKALFLLCVLPYRVICQTPLDKNQQYIFCPNHFSYLDIPTMGLNPVNAIFVGKHEMENIPLFGFMYRKLHITLDRTSLRSKYNTFIRSSEALDQGKSLVIYPEGGIITTNPPHMVRFKDGAFRLAIEKQIPIVPVTIPNNWIILPEEEFLLSSGTIEVIFHSPIETKGLTTDDLSKLKQQVFNIITDELKAHEHRPALVG